MMTLDAGRRYHTFLAGSRRRSDYLESVRALYEAYRGRLSCY
jgi:hypothetical protein